MVEFIILKYYREKKTNHSLQDKTYCLQQEKKPEIQVGDIKYQVTFPLSWQLL